MSNGSTMPVGRRGSWRVEIEEEAVGQGPSGHSSMAVAFRAPSRRASESFSSSEDAGSLGMYSYEEDDLPYPGFLAITWRCLHQTTAPRNYCLAMITNPWFERISMLVILLNCVTLGMYQPCVDESCSTNRCKILQMFDDAIFAFFAVEMVIKMVAMGWSGKGSYMADSWNRLDLFIVVAGGLEYFLAMEDMNLSAIRTIRVLRPLRAINRIPSMRILVMLLLDTLPMLGNVLLLCFFVFFIFGIVGVQLWAGMLRQRCFIDLPQNVTVPPGLKPIYYALVKPKTPITSYYQVAEQERDYICALPKDNGMHQCDNLPHSRYNGKVCNDSAQMYIPNDMSNETCVNWNQYYTDCRPGDKNPFQGAISFDNIGLAWVAIFLVISLEGWTDIMYYVQDAHSFWDWIYFVLLIVIGSFFMINLCLVVIATQFSETKKREMERMKMERARFQSTSTLASGSTAEPNSCYAEIIKYIAHLWRRGKRKLFMHYRQFRRRNRSDHPKQLSLKKQRRRRQYEAAQSALISRESGCTTGVPGTIVALPPSGPGAMGHGGALTIMNNIAPASPQLLSPPEVREVQDDGRATSAPCSGTEHSDGDQQVSPHRPVILKISSGDGSELVPPSPGTQGICTPRQRRRSSVMFSDVVLLHGHQGETATKNVCHSEKTTQTDDEPIDPAYFREPLPPSPHTPVPPALMPSLLSPPVLPFKKSKSPLHSVSRTPSYNGSTGKGSLTCGELLALSGALSAALPTHLGIDSHSVHTLYSSLAKGVKHFSAPTLFFSGDQAPAGFLGYYSASDSCDSGSDRSDDEWREQERRPPSGLSKICSKIQSYTKKLVEHRYFQRGILVAILINTLSMGIEYHNQPDILTVIVETSNYIFSAVFAVEMLLKIMAEGPFGYISNGYNVFDGIIVVLSVVEMYQSYSSTTQMVDQQAGQGSGLSVLRTFRLLRILKLVRFMPQLRRQLFVMLRTMDNVAIFFSLLILFIFIFSVLGMFLFGGKFCIRADGSGDCTCQEILDPESGCLCTRMHFNNFLWATVTVFQILTQEDWNVVLFNGMEKTSHWASLYFVALMTFGNYVLFNLLVAILVEGFSAERHERLEKEQKQWEKQKRKEQKALEKAEKDADKHHDNQAPQEEDKNSPLKDSLGEGVRDDPLKVAKVTLLQLSKGTTSTELSKTSCTKFPKSVSSEGFINPTQCGLSSDSFALVLPRGVSTEALTDVPSTHAPMEAIKVMPLENSKDFGKEEMLFRKVSEASKRPSPAFEDSGGIQKEHLPSVGLEATTQLTEDEKKRSISTLDGPDDDHRTLKGNEDRVKENHLRQKLLDDDPKCNIEKGFTPILATPTSQLGYPPIITHTAATPQGSPHSTLEPSGRGDLNNRLSPAMALYCSIPAEQNDRPQGVLRSGSIKSNNTSLSSRSSRASSRIGFHGVHRRESLSPHDLQRRRDSLSPSPGCFSISSHISSSISSISSSSSSSSSSGRSITPLLCHHLGIQERRSSGCGSPLSWRRSGSQRRRRGNSSGGSFRRVQLDRESLVRRDSGSDADGEEETALNNNINLTNNNNNLNNHQSSLLGTDHSHCNGSTSSHAQLAPRRSILTQQNSIGSPRTLSPQNSIRSRGSSPRSRQPSIQGQTSVCGSIKEVEYKQNNLSRAKEQAAVAEQEEAEEASEKETEVVRKICFVFEPKGCFKERQDYALYVFSPENLIRRACLFMVSRQWFDSTVLFFIGLNCITLAMERPNIPPDSVERYVLKIFNYIFTVVFGVEMVVKVIAQGLIYGKAAYFSSGWNIMDGSLVIISFVDIVMSFLATTSPRIFGILRVFRLLRALRPLRVINRAPGLKLVVQTLLSSLQPIGNIVLICCTFFIIFGILGVQLFKGSFYYCEGPHLKNVTTKSDCLESKENTWLNRKYNFDDLGQALMSLFVLSSKDGWVNIMYTGLDAVGVDMQPIENYSQWRLLYFISFLLLVGFFVLNMFVGVVVENFHRCREEQEKEEKARRAAKRAKKLEKKRRNIEKSYEEREKSLVAAGIDPASVDIKAEIQEERRRKRHLKLMKLQLKMREPPYYSQYSKARLFIHNIVTSKYFDLAIAAVIGLNVVTMAMEFYKMPKELEYALQIFNYFFTAVFILESVMKMVALGCHRYFQDSEEFRWNQLDVFIVILSVVGIVLEEMKSDLIPINPTIIRVMRVLRIARVLKLLKMAKGIRALLDTVMQALPQVGNLGLLFFLLFFIFAALGVELFGRLECDEEYPCQGLGEHAHFKNFGMAFLTLFRVATGDNWNGIMKDTLRDKCDTHPDCVKNCCLYPFVAPIFFVVFVLMAQFVLVNVVVAVLMKHLEESHKLEEEEAEFARLLRMEDEYDLEVEIERQLAQEEEEMAEMQENIANQKLAQKTTKDVNETVKAKFNSSKYFHKPLNKMSSLPSNFTFRGQKEILEQPPKEKTSPITPGLPDIRVETSLNIPRININGKGLETEGEAPKSPQPSFSHEEDVYNSNLKKPSPDEPINKVSITNLRHEPPSHDSGGARPRCSKPVVSKEKVVTESRKKSASEAPLAESYEGEDDISGADSITPTPSSPMLQDPSSPLNRRAARRSQWSSRREVSEGGGWKVSFDDSLTQTLMASFENVPELAGHVDMDSTSCSVCSSEDVSIASHLSSAGPSPIATSDSGPSTAQDNTQVYSPLPQVMPPPPLVFADNNEEEEDDPTLASSSDSFTLEGGIPEVPSFDSSPGSDGISGLSATVSPHSSCTSPALSSSNNEPAVDLVSHPPHLVKSSSNSTDHSLSSQPSPTTISAPLPAQHSSFSELTHFTKPFSSLGELRKDVTHQRPIQHWKAEGSKLLSSMTEEKQSSPLSLGIDRRQPFCFEISQPHHSHQDGSQMTSSSAEKCKPFCAPTIGLQLGDSKPRSKAQKSAGQRCYIRGRNKSRHSGTKS
ncbi:voltage-dependent T-type calcium channel subunit alpha-1I-like isoform X9 [Portunus trituberculatus]|uniref:voltage-dependent T-type calcium channel subunit alpha-1I-like isoform X9 n=1 Tax=Portunus trituberculatus TaxID=210409 RepID=UPI001E1D1CAA|nr:voltage-dependent T-type calcium channel subunit alpha-1I-like isoform X9 [Portunus trituberculatus]